MKIDKKNPKHWAILLVGVSLVFLCIPLRLFMRKKTGKKKVVLYGHKLNGNLLALYLHWKAKDDIECYYLTMDRDYAAQLRAENVGVLYATSFRDVAKLIRSDAFISDHGTHYFKFLRDLTSIKFVDVWHGIPYKGFDAEDFVHLHGHDQVWVSSEKMKQVYIDSYGFSPNKVKVTGYARVELIARYMQQEKLIKQRYGLDEDKYTILIAPTWKQDDKKRDIVPFGLSFESFIKSIQAASVEGKEVQIIFRAHLNSSVSQTLGRMKGVHMLSYADVPVAEELLAVSDVLITDWSSIVFDFMTTNRPVVYLDVEPPFAKGFTLGPEARFGAVVQDTRSLTLALRQALENPDAYQEAHKDKIGYVREQAYGTTLDHGVFERSDALLMELLK